MGWGRSREVKGESPLTSPSVNIFSLPFIMLGLTEELVVLDVCSKSYLAEQRCKSMERPLASPDRAWSGCKADAKSPRLCDN